MKEKPIWTFAARAWENPDGTFAGWDVVTQAVIAEHERRKAEWKLPDPPEGEQWHRTDKWTADDLPPPYRPLLRNEKPESGDEIKQNEDWCRQKTYQLEVYAKEHHAIQRTTRPLPVKPAPVLAPLGPDDVPQGAEFRRGKDRLSYSVISESGVTLSLLPDMTFTWADLHHCGWEMRPINGKWQPCANEVQP